MINSQFELLESLPNYICYYKMAFNKLDAEQAITKEEVTSYILITNLIAMNEYRARKLITYVKSQERG